MIRKTFFIITNIALVALIALGGFPTRSAAQGFSTKLSINEIKLVGAINPPSSIQVSWSLTGLLPDTRVEGVEVKVALRGNGQTGNAAQTIRPNISSGARSNSQTGNAAQTASPGVTLVSVSLQGIPAETRAKIFGGPERVSANVSVIVTLIRSSGTRSTISTVRGASFNPLPNQAAPAPTPKPTPNLDAIREGLKKRVVARPTPTPQPKS
ncbi:MAG: hypothetical protein ACREBD_31395 [Blastocatellia bacterium]